MKGLRSSFSLFASLLLINSPATGDVLPSGTNPCPQCPVPQVREAVKFLFAVAMPTDFSIVSLYCRQSAFVMSPMGLSPPMIPRNFLKPDWICSSVLGARLCSLK